MDELRSLLKHFLDQDDDHLWIIDSSVFFDGDWDSLSLAFDECPADLLATEVRTQSEDPEWTWWPSLKDDNGQAAETGGVAALLPLMRVSRAAAQAICDGLEAGWTGHREALVPTLVHRAGLKIEDIGNEGSFTPLERRCQWYDRRTWHWQGPVEHVPGRLHFPVPLQSRSLAGARIQTLPESRAPRFLYVSPVGEPGRELLPAVLGRFQSAGADCLLLQYDDAELSLPPGTRLIRDRGYKWQLALRHLNPEALEDYDYVFFWDDDIGVADFDPARFMRIMQSNRLDMAQPAIRSPHGLSHSITGFRPLPPPWRDPDGVTAHPVVGRLTNFAEIMVPVFTREAWREFYGYLDPDNRSGWGYDYIPFGRKGVVDALPVVHTRAVQSINGNSEDEIRRFLNAQGLFRYPTVDQGWLFEVVQAPTDVAGIRIDQHNRSLPI